MKNKPKILIFSEWFLPAFKAGGPIRSILGLVTNTSSEYEFFIVSSSKDLNEKKILAGIKINKWKKKENYSIIYLHKEKLTYSKIKRLVLAINPSFVYLNSLFSYRFTILPILVCKMNFENIKVVLAPRGMLGEGALTVKKGKKSLFLSLFRKLNYFNNVRWHASNVTEKQQILKHFGQNQNVYIASNLSPKITNDATFSGNKNTGELRIIQIARISKEKNTLYSIELLKNIKGKIEMDIIGESADLNYLERCKNAIARLPTNISVNLMGSKNPNEIKEYLKRDYHLFFLPTLGENYGHSIVEAMNFGIPLLISDKTPWKSLEKYNAGFCVSLEEENMMEKLQKFVNLDCERWLEMKRGVLKYVRQNNNIQLSINQNKLLFN